MAMADAFATPSTAPAVAGTATTQQITVPDHGGFFEGLPGTWQGGEVLEVARDAHGALRLVRVVAPLASPAQPASEAPDGSNSTPTDEESAP